MVPEDPALRTARVGGQVLVLTDTRASGKDLAARPRVEQLTCCEDLAARFVEQLTRTGLLLQHSFLESLGTTGFSRASRCCDGFLWDLEQWVPPILVLRLSLWARI